MIKIFRNIFLHGFCKLTFPVGPSPESCSRLTPYIFVLSTMDARENTYMIPRIWIGSRIPKSPKAGRMPLDFYTHHSWQSRGEAAIRISDGAHRPRCCWGRWNDRHLMVLLAEWRTTLTEFFWCLTQDVIFSPQNFSRLHWSLFAFCFLLLSHIFSSLDLSSSEF